MAEQQPDPARREEPVHDEPLRQQGIVCAACHVRARQRYGPPRRSDAVVPKGAPLHAGFEARPEFEESRFCASCHQFFDDRMTRQASAVVLAGSVIVDPDHHDRGAFDCLLAALQQVLP